MFTLIRIQVIGINQKMLLINPDFIVEVGQYPDDTFYVQLTTGFYSIDKNSFVLIKSFKNSDNMYPI